jgi:tetratricopeptide (TPR) repeat protein
VRLFSGAVQSYNNALEINTLKSAPEKWMNGQYNLAVALRDLALASAPEERERILGESVQAYEKTLNYSRQTAPAEWAQTQYNIAIVLSYQAESGKKEDRARRLGEAAAAYREALKVHTPKDAPQEHSATQYNLAFVLRAQALASTGDERVRLRGEAVQAVRESVKGVENPKPLYLVLSQFLGGYSYELLFAKKPQEAIDAATEALELAPEEIWAATNLTEGLLLSGQYEKAEALCRKNARVLLEGNKSFVESVFADLDALHAAGVTHPDVEKFKKQLSPLLTPPDKTFSGLLPEEQSTQLPLSL